MRPNYLLSRRCTSCHGAGVGDVVLTPDPAPAPATSAAGSTVPTAWVIAGVLFATVTVAFLQQPESAK
jgi:hypothetical protein